MEILQPEVHHHYLIHVLLITRIIDMASCTCIGGFEVCDIIPWMTWSECSTKCGRGIQRRIKPICCDTRLDFWQCLNDCKIDYNQYRKYGEEKRYCAVCFNGTYNSTQNACQCFNGYTGACCNSVEPVTRKPTSSMPITARSTTPKLTAITLKPTTTKPSTKKITSTTTSRASTAKTTPTTMTTPTTITTPTKTTTLRTTTTPTTTTIPTTTTRTHRTTTKPTANTRASTATTTPIITTMLTTITTATKTTTHTTTTPSTTTTTAKTSTRSSTTTTRMTKFTTRTQNSTIMTTKSTTANSIVGATKGASTWTAFNSGIQLLTYQSSNLQQLQTQKTELKGTYGLYIPSRNEHINIMSGCIDNPCFNGTCIPVSNQYLCFCSPGFEGKYCELDTNECANDPCMNGHCGDKVNDFECECNVSLKGKRVHTKSQR